MKDPLPVRIATAGWSIPPDHKTTFPAIGTHLERYASVFNAVEINSSFHRPHSVATYQRWAASVPETFRFAVKVPKTITHLRKLSETGDLLDRFQAEIAGLGLKLGPLLVQLPPSLAFDADIAAGFFGDLRARVAGGIACEPRNASWFTPEADALLDGFRIGRVGADPARVPEAAQPGGWPGLIYHRLHGSPRIYHSPYSEQAVEAVVVPLALTAREGSECWCVFDNTASGAATVNALTANGLLAGGPAV